MTAVAATLDEAVTAEWLTAALDERYPGVVVEHVEVRELLHGVGTKALLTLTFGGSHDHGLPMDMCLKAGYEEHNRFLLEGGTYLKEARFYRDVASEVPMVVPRCLYAGCDDESKQGVLLLEDLPRAGAHLGSAGEGHTVDEAARFLDAFAALHATYDGGRIIGAHPWVGSTSPLQTSYATMYTDRLRGNLADGRADTLPEAVRDPERLIKAAQAIVGLLDPARSCLVHGDPHAGNLYLTASGEPGVYDWQTAHASSWAIDVPYYLCAGLSHDDRRDSIEDLLRHYLDRLVAHGGTPPSWDDAWLAYRQFIPYGFYLWAITRPIVQPVPVINTFIDRLGTAAADVGSYEALGV